MKKIAFQIQSDYTFKPFSQEDLETAKNYKIFQVVKANVSGVKKPRSYQQLKLYFACCKKVAENTSDPNWNTKEKVSFQCKVGLHFVDPSVVAVRPDGMVVFRYRSISFKSLGHMEACNYFDRAFELMAKKIGVSIDELIKNSEE